MPRGDGLLFASELKASVPAVAEPYREQYYYAWWVLGNNILSPYGYFRRESVSPSKAHYVGAWQWDNYFHALAFRYNDPRLAHDQIMFMLDHQLPDGMIPDAVYDEGTITQLASFGAFARIEDGIEGLIHVSEFDDQSGAEKIELQPDQAPPHCYRGNALAAARKRNKRPVGAGVFHQQASYDVVAAADGAARLFEFTGALFGVINKSN